MDITRITRVNAEFFEELAPEGSFDDEELVWLGAIDDDGTACAVLGGGAYEGMGFIDWIYTAPQHREKGAASKLLKTFCVLLERIDADAVEISFDDTDEELYEFLVAEDFLISKESNRYSVPIEDLIYSEAIENLAEGREPSGKIVSAARLEDPGLVYKYLSDRNIPFFVYKDELAEYSLILMDDNDEIRGCMMIVKEEEGDIQIPYLVNDGSMGGITDLFLGLKELIIEKRWEEESIVFSDRTGQMIGFVEQVTDNDRDSYVIGGLQTGVKLF